MKFTLIIKSGLKELSRIDGQDVDPRLINFADIQKVIETEQHLERMFGLRFHIQTGE